MSDSEAEIHGKIMKLTSTNYNVWTVALQGMLMTVNAWRIVTEEYTRPTDIGEASKWLLKKEEAAGILLKSLSLLEPVLGPKTDRLDTGHPERNTRNFPPHDPSYF
jgi:hypothetical protein